ncbi:MAG: histidine ammonia-lyase [Vicinamibacterales bacterium]
MIALDGNSLTLEALERIATMDEPVTLTDTTRARVAAARRVVDIKAEGEAAVYGVNTGFGSLAEVRIPRASLGELQVNLLRSHACGVDEPLPRRTVRATMALRANVLAKGFSGIRVETLEALLALLNHRVHPVVPSRGSVGASGDLAPLAHLALVLIGEGTALVGDERLAGRTALERAGLPPVALRAKEGLALINGTQPSTAVLALAVADAWRLARATDVAVALTLDALRGSMAPFDARVHETRAFPGQAESASNVWRLLQDSAINASHANCGKVQDAYSLRCAAQVHGAARDALRFARRTVEIEANAATDNPMVFADRGDMISGGNFHGAPIAVAADVVAIGVAQLATISERRTDRLMNTAVSELPPFLVAKSGLQSGFMMAHVTAAALTAEAKTLAHPASVDSIPTSAGREDHVSMSMGAALKAARAVEVVRRVVAVEVLSACQALDLLHPLTTSAPLAEVHRAVRRLVPPVTADRPLGPDIETIAAALADGTLLSSAPPLS